MMNLNEALEKYFDKFGEHFPVMCFRGTTDDEMIKTIEESLKSGKPVEFPELNQDLPPVY